MHTVIYILYVIWRIKYVHLNYLIILLVIFPFFLQDSDEHFYFSDRKRNDDA